MTYRVLDLFSGIGGFSLGLERTGGFETVAFCEIDPFCRKILRKHWPDVPIHDDVTTYEFRESEADVITAGFPCQDISFAGAGAGLAGARSGLYREVIRAVRLVRPKFAILENVAALLGRGLGTVLGDLAEVGYDAEWHCIPAGAVGAPHRRDRIWIVAYPKRSESIMGCSANGVGGRAGKTEQTGVGGDCEYPDAKGKRRAEARELRHDKSSERSAGIREEMADATSSRCSGPREPLKWSSLAPSEEWEAANAFAGCVGNFWATEPDVGRVAHGVPQRVDRLRSLGNAVVPQIPELIGRAILEAAA